MKKVVLFSLLVGAVTLLSSCGTSYSLLNNNVYNDRPITPKSTFSVVPYDASKLPVQISIYDVQNIQRAIANELSIRGFKEDQSGNGTYKVLTTLYSKVNVETKDAIPDWAPVRPALAGTMAPMYRSYYDDASIIGSIDKEGVLAVDLIDASNKPVWDAAISSIVDSGDDLIKEIKDPKEINKAAETLFSKFPIPAPTVKK